MVRHPPGPPYGGRPLARGRSRQWDTRKAVRNDDVLSILLLTHARSRVWYYKGTIGPNNILATPPPHRTINTVRVSEQLGSSSNVPEILHPSIAPLRHLELWSTGPETPSDVQTSRAIPGWFRPITRPDARHRSSIFKSLSGSWGSGDGALPSGLPPLPSCGPTTRLAPLSSISTRPTFAFALGPAISYFRVGCVAAVSMDSTKPLKFCMASTSKKDEYRSRPARRPSHAHRCLF